MEGERFLSLPLAVETSIDGGILPDFLHFPSVLVRHHQHVLKHSLKKGKASVKKSTNTLIYNPDLDPNP